MKADDPRHGTSKGFDAHRRAGEEPCDDCRRGRNRALKVYRVTGNWPGNEKSGLVRLGEDAWEQLARTLPGHFAKQSGLSARGLRQLRTGGPDSPCKRRTREKILRTPAVSAVGIQRRLQALSALGWSAAELSRHTTVDKATLVNLRLGHPLSYIEPPTVDAILALYDKFSMRPAPPSSSSRQARPMAEAKGWLPPLAWDDIDDPNEQPHAGTNHRANDDVDEVVVMRLLAGEPIHSTRAEKDEAMRRWRRAGGSEAEMCRIHGWKDSRYGREDAA